MNLRTIIAMTICVVVFTMQAMERPKVKFTYLPGVGPVQEHDPRNLHDVTVQAERDYAARQAAAREAEERREVAQILLELHAANN